MKALLFFGIIFISLSCFSQQNIYIFFENNTDGMFKSMTSDNDSSYYFTIKPNRNFWYGFAPKSEGEIVTKSFFKSKIKPDLKNIEWLRFLCNHYPDSLRNRSHLYIVEELKTHSYQITPVSKFEAME